jgi:hypothetical protein
MVVADVFRLLVLKIDILERPATERRPIAERKSAVRESKTCGVSAHQLQVETPISSHIPHRHNSIR